MRDLLKLLTLLLALSPFLTACSMFGGDDSSDSGDNSASASSDKKDKDNDDDEKDPDKARVAAARAAWPAYTGESSDLIDLAAYTTVTLVDFVNLTDNSEEDDAGGEFVIEIKDALNNRYDSVFATVRIADKPLGQADELVVRGQIYDFSKGGGYNYWTGRNKAKFKAEFVVENGQSGAVLKSSKISESGYDDNTSQLEGAAHDLAKMLARSKTKGSM